MKNHAYHQGNVDQTPLFAKIMYDKVVIFLVYMDDMIFIGNDYKEIVKTKGTSAIEFKLKYLGNVNCLLGIEIVRLETRLVLNQE